MRKLVIKNKRVQASIHPIQKLWLQMWQELLHPSTIDPHAVPPINSIKLITDMISIEGLDIREDRKVSILPKAMKELMNGIHGIYNDQIIKKEFKDSILSLKPPRHKTRLCLLYTLSICGNYNKFLAIMICILINCYTICIA